MKRRNFTGKRETSSSKRRKTKRELHMQRPINRNKQEEGILVIFQYFKPLNGLSVPQIFHLYHLFGLHHKFGTVDPNILRQVLNSNYFISSKRIILIDDVLEDIIFTLSSQIFIPKILIPNELEILINKTKTGANIPSFIRCEKVEPLYNWSKESIYEDNTRIQSRNHNNNNNNRIRRPPKDIVSQSKTSEEKNFNFFTGVRDLFLRDEEVDQTDAPANDTCDIRERFENKFPEFLPEEITRPRKRRNSKEKKIVKRVNWVFVLTCVLLFILVRRCFNHSELEPTTDFKEDESNGEQKEIFEPNINIAGNSEPNNFENLENWMIINLRRINIEDSKKNGDLKLQPFKNYYELFLSIPKDHQDRMVRKILDYSESNSREEFSLDYILSLINEYYF